jgi:adenine-specific DNA-methyltransferase
MGASSHAGQVYAIQNPFTGKLHYPQEGRCWRNERAKMKAAVEAWGVVYEDVDLGDGLRPGLVIRGVRDPKNAGPKTDPVIAKARSSALARHAAGNWPRAFWRADRQRRPGEGELRYKTYEEEVKEGVVPTTYWPDEWDVLELGSTAWPHEEAGTTHTGLRELNAIVGRGHGFDTVKPLALIERIINLWCPEDGLILDPFAGSGTTGHAVLKLNQDDSASRRFVLIEQGRPEKGDPYARSLLANRLQRAISGKWADGKGTAVGGGFRFSQLQKTVDAKALLGMEREEMTDAVIASHFDSSRRGGPGLVIMANEGYEYLVGRNSEGEGFFLIWNLSKGSPVFDEKVYDAVVKEARAAALKPRYHVYARFNYFQSDDVQFYQIPDQILLDFGLSPSEPFNNESAAQ